VDIAIKALHSDIAVAQWKAAKAILDGHDGDPMAAERAINAAVGYGINEQTASLLTTLMWSHAADDPNTYSRIKKHTVNGQTSAEGWPYGTTHDMDCPGCSDTPFTSSPRSEAYWSA
jgi:hypothetical protein